jgi:hypothetical protein
MDWRELDVDISPGHYHFEPQSPRVPMRYRRAAVMRGYDTDMGAPGVGAVTLTIHDRPGSGRPAVRDDELPHFDVGEDGVARPRVGEPG